MIYLLVSTFLQLSLWRDPLLLNGDWNRRKRNRETQSIILQMCASLQLYNSSQLEVWKNKGYLVPKKRKHKDWFEINLFRLTVCKDFNLCFLRNLQVVECLIAVPPIILVPHTGKLYLHDQNSLYWCLLESLLYRSKWKHTPP